MILKGLKVIEFAGLAPAPFCGMFLSEFGASVVRVDKIGSNVDLDPLGNGKKSISINLKHSKGIDILKKLSRCSDVLIEPFRTGVMESLGLGPNDLLKDNPQLIYARLTGFGQDGYYSKRPGHDVNYFGLSGLLSLSKRTAEKPMFPANLVANFGGGAAMCSLGILLALIDRANSGLGQVIDSNMLEGTTYLGSWLYRTKDILMWGDAKDKNRLDTTSHFYEIYETKDNKYMSVAPIEPRFYNELIKGLELNSADASQYESDPEEMKKVFASKFSKKTQDDWCKIFDNLNACVFPVLTMQEAPLHPHHKGRQSFVKGLDGYAPKPTPKLSRSPGISKSTELAPKRGENTEMILKSLNYTVEEIAELLSEGVVEIPNLSK